MEKKWEEMSADEKQEQLFQRWFSPQGVEFVSPETEKSYKDRITRIKDALQMRKLPDRVPVIPNVGFFPAFYAGLTPQEIMYDYDKLNMAWQKYALDFQPDAHIGCFVPGPGRLFEILDYKLYAWPGHGASPYHTYQCLEGEYMKADEYDAFILDPTGFFERMYLPRIFHTLEPFKMLAPLPNIIELPFTGGNLLPYGLPEVQTAMKALMEAGTEALKWVEVLVAHDKEMAAAGYPNFFGGAAKAPFDYLADTLRGTRGIMLDLYRQPDKIIKACDVITPLMVGMGVSMAKMNGNPVVFIPLHKGADGFMSDEQFKTFYWSSFRKLLMGLIDEGCIPYSFVEGGYNSRLEVIKDLPKGKAIWSFDLTDMKRAKEIVGQTACISGNVPITLLNVGTESEVKDYVKELIDTAGRDGGYIMNSGAVIDEAKPENVKAMIDFTKEYGIYK
jgi:hypothetical protein